MPRPLFAAPFLLLCAAFAAHPTLAHAALMAYRAACPYGMGH